MKETSSLKKIIIAMSYLGISTPIIVGLLRNQNVNMAGIFFGNIFFAWYMAQNYIWPKKVNDTLYQKEMDIQRRLFAPYKKNFFWLLVILFLTNVVLYGIAGDMKGALLLDFSCMVMILIYMGWVRRNADREAMLGVAHELGFSFNQKGDIASLESQFQSIGHSQRVSNVFSGHLEGYPMRIFTYSFTKGYGKSSELFNFGILELTLKTAVPKILILNKDSRFHPHDFSLSASTTLEGNFPDYFSVNTESGAETEVRELLTPDIMVLLIDTMPDYDFILLGNKLYVSIIPNPGNFIREYFLERLNRAKDILNKWLPIISRIDFH